MRIDPQNFSICVNDRCVMLAAFKTEIKRRDRLAKLARSWHIMEAHEGASARLHDLVTRFERVTPSAVQS